MGGVPRRPEVLGRPQRDHPVGPAQGFADLGNEVLARDPVPHIQFNRVARVRELGGHPLRPGTVSPRMADEEIDPACAHIASIPHSAPRLHRARIDDIVPAAASSTPYISASVPVRAGTGRQVMTGSRSPAPASPRTNWWPHPASRGGPRQYAS